MPKWSLNTLSTPLQAVVLMLFSMAFFSGMNVAIRVATHDMESTYLVFLRNVCSIGLVVLWTAALQRGRPRFPTARLSGHFWRATIGIAAMEMWFHAISLLPLTLATALSFTTPIFSTMIAIVFLGEKAGLRRWSAIGVGFLGYVSDIAARYGGYEPECAFCAGVFDDDGGGGGDGKNTHTHRSARDDCVLYGCVYDAVGFFIGAAYYACHLAVSIVASVCDLVSFYGGAFADGAGVYASRYGDADAI